MNLSIFGAGAWGTALAWHWEKQGHTVTLLPRTLEAALEIAENQRNIKYLPQVTLPLSLQIGLEPTPALMEADAAIFACPVSALREIARSLQASRSGAAQARQWKWVIATCKGLEPGTHLRPSEILKQELPGLSVAALSGPSFAYELVENHPTAVTLASDAPEEELTELQKRLSGGNLRLYRSADLTGVEISGALKNPYAIVAGICDGLKLGYNTKAALLTRSLAEMVRFGVAYGGNRETFYGLSGVGDLSATFHGPISRNRILGEKIGLGESAEEALPKLSGVAEGYTSCKTSWELARKLKVETPILTALYQVLYENLSPQEALQDLLNRDLKSEF